MSDSTLEAIWVIESETGERRLIVVKTGEDITPREAA